MVFATIDIKIERDCYMYIYRAPLVGSVTRGGKAIFRVKGEYQKLPHKLCLSTFEHHFPEGTTEYWFGIMKPTDITQNTSEISNAIYNQ